MPAEKRPLAGDDPFPPPPPPPEKEAEEANGGEGGDEEDGEEDGEEGKNQQLPEQENDSAVDDDEDEGDSECESDKDEFIFVKLADIRKEVQCPICLGIVRKTRTVMECLHRFCRECIDKSMRLGNNECPACRTHCASRRSLRDDPNYDALIAALYPDIDKYEEEELAFHEEEKNRNKKIQASIAETFRRQSEALGRRKSSAKATAAAFMRKSHCRRGRGRKSARDTSLAVSDEEEEEEANENVEKESSSADEPSSDRGRKRHRRWPTARSSPAKTAGNANIGDEENDDVETSRDNRGTSPLRVGNREMLAWGKGGVRSQMRHGSSSGASGRFVKGGRVTKLVEYIRSLQENDNEFGVHLMLLPMDEGVANLQRPYICCRPTLSIRHLCQFIALEMSVKAEDVEIFARKPQDGSLELNPSTLIVKVGSNPSKEPQVVGAQESVAGLLDSFTDGTGDLVLVYRLKMQS